MPSKMSRSTAIELTVVLPNAGRILAIDVRLIETIDDCRSISGAGRRLDISYRKTWRMVDALNRMFTARVVDTFPGRRDGGAAVTPFGARLVALYRSMERRTNASTTAALAEIVAAIDKNYEPDLHSEVDSA